MKTFNYSLLVFLTFILLFSCSIKSKLVYGPDFPGPKLHFNDTSTPTEPDYRQKDFWMSLPKSTKDSKVDVFWVHPTTFNSNKYWNMPFDDSESKDKAKNTLITQAGVFNNSNCAIYAPYYRQANIYSLKANENDKENALDIGFRDVSNAFEFYLKNYNNNKPFIIAGHSQGSQNCLKLLKKYNIPQKNNFIAAYIIGWSVTNEDISKYTFLKMCNSADETGCIISYNTMENGSQKNAPTLLAGAVAVNPLLWNTSNDYAPETLNKGAVFFDEDKIKDKISNYTSAQISTKIIGEALIVPTPSNINELDLGGFGPGIYHKYDYSFFYENLKENVITRINSFFMRKKNNKNISVHHEWGKLKEVIVGIGDDLVMPSYNKKISFIYDPKFIDMMKEYGGRKASEIEPKEIKEVIKQINGLAKELELRGVKVHRTHRLTEPAEKNYLSNIQKGSMFLYARDPILVIENNVIETAIKIPMRAKEKFAIRPILKERLKNSNAKYIAVPTVSPVFGEDGIYLEGGDVLLNGYDIYVGNSGRGSNKAGIAWLQQFLGSEYKVHEIKIIPEFEHLDCVLSLIRPGLGIICKDAIIGELPKSIRNWDYINVSIAEAKKLGANLFVLDEKTCIVDKQHHRIAEQLRKHGQEVIEIPYDKVAEWGGAFRCSHHPLIRESELKKDK